MLTVPVKEEIIKEWPSIAEEMAKLKSIRASSKIANRLQISLERIKARTDFLEAEFTSAAQMATRVPKMVEEANQFRERAIKAETENVAFQSVIAEYRKLVADLWLKTQSK